MLTLGVVRCPVVVPPELNHTQAFYTFNKAVTTTNLWKQSKAAVSYRLDPSKFLAQHKVGAPRLLQHLIAAPHSAQHLFW